MTDIHIAAGHKERRKEAVSRAIGFGPVVGDRLVGNDGNRVTLLGEDQIRRDERHEWRVPLPVELRSSTEFRRVVVTLAWLTPVSSHSSQYRTFALNLVGATGKSDLWEGVKRIGHQPSIGFARRGTLIHSVYEGERKAVPFDENGNFIINVQAMAKMPGVSSIAVPYALAVTIEVADSINSDISASIRRRVLPQAQVTR